MDKLKMQVIVQSADYKDGEPSCYIFRFELVESAAFKYGNGKALDVYQDGVHWKTVDVRYTSIANLVKLARTVLDDYYGPNLKAALVIAGAILPSTLIDFYAVAAEKFDLYKLLAQAVSEVAYDSITPEQRAAAKTAALAALYSFC